MVKAMTETNLKNAYSGESQAHMRYLIYADLAQREGFPNVSRLFQTASFAEEVHARNHFRHIKTKGEDVTIGGAIFGTTTTSEALQAGIDGETFEIIEMYPAYIAVAKAQEEKGAETTFYYALEAEKQHMSLYKKSKESVDKGKDANLGPLHACSVCGYTVEGEAPDPCPVCKSPKKVFREF